MGPRRVTGLVLLFYVNDVRTSQETYLLASTACYGEIFTFLYVDVFVPHRKHLRASAVCYANSYNVLLVLGNILKDVIC
jgi:hypothetical protein